MDPNHAVKPKRKVRGGAAKKLELPWVLLRSLGGGLLMMAVLFCLFAFLWEKIAFPIGVVHPLACGAVAVGTALSGLLLAVGIRRGFLLCGILAGVFYDVCLSVAMLILGAFTLTNSTLTLWLILLLAGALGGALGAVLGKSGVSAAAR
jgi:putative membrane protein (TIGR04086 family)